MYLVRAILCLFLSFALGGAIPDMRRHSNACMDHALPLDVRKIQLKIV